MEQSSEEILIAIKKLFDNKDYFAKFVNREVFEELSENLQATPSLKHMIDTVEFYSDTFISQLTETTKLNVTQSASRDPFVIHQLLYLKQEPLLDDKQFAVLQSLFDAELDVDIFENNQLPNIMLATPSKFSDKMHITFLNCRNCEKERHLCLKTVSELQYNLPNLKSLKLHSVTLDTVPVTQYALNHLHYLAIHFFTLPKDLSNLLVFITKSYASHLKSLILEQLGPEVSFRLLDLKYTDKHVDNLIKEGQEFKYPKLKVLKLNNLYQCPTLVAKFVEAVIGKDCVLRKVSLKGLYDNSLLNQLTDLCHNTLTNISINIDDQTSLMHLSRAKNLKHLRCRLSGLSVNLSIYDILKSLPQLEDLNFGFDQIQGYMRHVSNSNEKFKKLHKLTLENISYNDQELIELQYLVPRVKRIAFDNCNLVRKGGKKLFNSSFKDITPDSLVSSADELADNGTSSEEFIKKDIDDNVSKKDVVTNNANTDIDLNQVNENDDDNNNDKVDFMETDTIEETVETTMTINDKTVEENEKDYTESNNNCDIDDTSKVDEKDFINQDKKNDLTEPHAIQEQTAKTNVSTDNGMKVESKENSVLMSIGDLQKYNVKSNNEAQKDAHRANSSEEDAVERNENVETGNRDDHDGSSEAADDSFEEGKKEDENGSQDDKDDDKEKKDNNKKESSDSDFKEDISTETESDSERTYGSEFGHEEDLRRSTRIKRKPLLEKLSERKKRPTKFYSPESGVSESSTSRSAFDDSEKALEEEPNSDKTNGFFYNVKNLKPVIRIIY